MKENGQIFDSEFNEVTNNEYEDFFKEMCSHLT